MVRRGRTTNSRPRATTSRPTSRLNADQADVAAGTTYPRLSFRSTRIASDGILRTLPQRSTLIGVCVRPRRARDQRQRSPSSRAPEPSPPTSSHDRLGDGTPPTPGRSITNGSFKGAYRVSARTPTRNGCLPGAGDGAQPPRRSLSPLPTRTTPSCPRASSAAMAQDPTSLTRLGHVPTNMLRPASSSTARHHVAISENGGGTWAPRIIAAAPTSCHQPPEGTPMCCSMPRATYYIAFSRRTAPRRCYSSKDGGRTSARPS